MASLSWDTLSTSNGAKSFMEGLENRTDSLLDNFHGTTDPLSLTNPVPAGTKCFLWADDTDTGGGVRFLKIRGQDGAAYYKVGRLNLDYMGLLDTAGNNAMGADLDFAGFIPKGVASAAATAGPTHTSGDKWFSIKDTAGTTFYLHGQQSAP